MSAELVGSKRRWAASVVGALVIMVAVVSLLRVPAPSSPPLAPAFVSAPTGPGARQPIQLSKDGGIDQKLADETVMHEQMPLFLPTPRNVTIKPPSRPEAGRVMLDQQVFHNSFGAGDLRLHLPPPETVAEKPTEVILNGAPAVPLYGFGRGNAPLNLPPPHGAVVEVFSAETNQRVLGPVVLGTDAKPPTERSWRPLEFLARVTTAGLAAPLTITVRSDVEEVDKFFRNYLGETFRIGDRLPPGSYRIIVGP